MIRQLLWPGRGQLLSFWKPLNVVNNAGHQSIGRLERSSFMHLRYLHRILGGCRVGISFLRCGNTLLVWWASSIFNLLQCTLQLYLFKFRPLSCAPKMVLASCRMFLFNCNLNRNWTTVIIDLLQLLSEPVHQQLYLFQFRPLSCAPKMVLASCRTFLFSCALNKYWTAFIIDLFQM